ncbi:hypothetical protein A5906_05325 [Bradyrhizobium sacchari]|uniref:Uncharacterized protein n=1 Tax=Bradyrhizobium sacchari TaxID=1399419 RepID=A0A560JEP7_9BRAD|nr:hypothetical protein [Bradyrhizobium sacchari]OPY96005.1 hypothetical protein A5906_05325 [Bradyrhizobium sacchari]TWB51262.1 hypothetical protein FBZ94_11092 [Bradyrhizobium sacchari]TWB69496.1 hypothetical protein FBZ95_10992 [Bradyrhizobium sacchari]
MLSNGALDSRPAVVDNWRSKTTDDYFPGHIKGSEGRSFRFDVEPCESVSTIAMRSPFLISAVQFRRPACSYRFPLLGDQSKGVHLMRVRDDKGCNARLFQKGPTYLANREEH